jgi:hypothetical protein
MTYDGFFFREQGWCQQSRSAALQREPSAYQPGKGPVNMRVGANEPGFSATQLFVGLNQVDANTTITLAGTRGSDVLNVYMLSSFTSPSP